MSVEINTEELNLELSLSDEELEGVLEDLFNDFMAEYELDPEGSINDMLFEFFAEGFVKALEVVSEDEEGDSEEA